MSPKIRRLFFGSLVLLTIAALSLLMLKVLEAEGFTAAEWVLFACFMVTLPWTAIGFWNAAIGFVLMRFSDDPAIRVFPDAATITGNEPVTTSTAIGMCVRNEDASQVYRNLNAMIARLVASGVEKNFTVYILSDSNRPDVLAAERDLFRRLQLEWDGTMSVVYRRREDNPGFKAGNIRDFCERWGAEHDFLLTLDADSVMSASAILRLVRIMQKNGQIGILQSLVVGLPSSSAFTRVFQFGMRLGMKSYTLGSAWWQADCGPYWGHNALIRLKPFIEHCHLPKLAGTGPLSGWILSHDQVEAVYMRRAGFECRVLAEEGGSYEENPPHILEFIRRDLRWCHGNMQYFKLLTEPGLKPTSRVQLVLAILMFIGSPAWMLFVSIATLSVAFPWLISLNLQVEGPGYALFAIIMTMIFAPKIASVIDVMMRPDLRRDFGGSLAVASGSLLEIVFSMMLAPIMAIANTIFLFKLFIMRKPKAWEAQSRQTEALPPATVLRFLWPQMLFGMAGFAVVFSGMKVDWVAVAMCVPVFVGPLFVLPFGVTSSNPDFGGLASRVGLWQLPEEQYPPIILRALHLPAMMYRGKGVGALQDQFGPLSTKDLLDLGPEFDSVPADPAGERYAA